MDVLYQLCLFQIRSLSFLEKLLPAIRRFLNAIQKKSRRVHTFTTDVLFYSSFCRSCHKAVPLAAIFFGNIQGGVFINHWVVSSPRQFFKFICVHFFYDVLNIHFVNEEGSNYIRRIIVDNAISDENGRNRTRFHFELNCPVVIRRGLGHRVNRIQYERFRAINRGRSSDEIPHILAFSDSPIFTVEIHESILDSKIYSILSRLRLRTGISIEFASLHVRFVCRFISVLKMIFGPHIAKLFFPKTNGNFSTNRERRFSLKYLIECLISRGAVVKDQLLLKKTMWMTFLKVINFCYLQARERIITMIDERKRIGSIVKVGLGCFKKSESNFLEVGKMVLLRRISSMFEEITPPFRVIYTVPEVIMANRVLRMYDHDGTRMIRVTFRDDDNLPMRTNKTSLRLIRMTVRKYLCDGVFVAGRDFGYLGSSNSQMRDSGAYFLEKYSKAQYLEYSRLSGTSPPITWQPKIDGAREMLGRFTQIESVPKLMARLGQCFTQTRVSVNDTYDGVGMISKDLAAEIAKDMQMGSCVPSCFQFRFRGMKGVVVVDPVLDEISLWAKRFNIAPPKVKFGSWDVKLMFRPSQIKFKAMRTSTDSLEVVKFSSPIPVSLNKPFIAILDQVSEMQSYECHSRITNRIEQLLDDQLRGMARSILREHNCRSRLKELPQRIDISVLSALAGFQLSTEPFFRSLIKASIKFTITKLMHKQQIQIPPGKGRTMFGVVDETGQLQYGQVFIQYTANIALKMPPPTASKKILTGKVLLTKNPCIVAGDVRVFTAVDIPALHHLCDVVVFPMHGPRPHPDEMAGSDLDGDEYTVIWDEDLLLDHNEKPFDYTAEKPESESINEETLTDMIEFFVKHITQDSIGMISTSYLFQEDLYGINSEVCHRLAVKISKAVDFAKTGLPPDPLVREWTIDQDSGREIPPEKNERRPDFHGTNDYDPIYRSPRLLGRIYRLFKAIEDVLKVSEDIGEQEEIECDRYLIVDGWLAYKEKAEAELAKYNGRLRAFMENYGIKTEGEIFSGCISEMRNRISDRDQDDMSLYNTTEIIERKVTSLFRDFREEFFKEFGGWESCTQKSDKNFALEENVFYRTANKPTLKMQQKAVAYYRICYERAQQTRERMLSFAWIAYDILAVVRQENALKEIDSIQFTTPLYGIFMVLCGHSQYIPSNLSSFSAGLDCVMFIVSEWAEQNGLFSVRLKCHHLCLIIILYATGRIAGNSAVLECPLEKINDERQIELLVTFFEYLASRAFRKLRHISFSDLGYASVFLRGEWLPLHEAAVRTYYNMVFNLQFDELNENRPSDPLRSLIIRECEPFVIELPGTNRILQKTGVKEISLRRLTTRSLGTLQSLRKLRNLLTIEPSTKDAICGKNISAQFSRLTYENIMR
ncbi:unnamed protein product [Angiostrongylus costaricensis]|uniref:RNA-dependent RNA polymerase n=1 Tax=Angiostrongylus costaricensis TaxID=334426 RepID=A0A158PF10_ANGCS|nr:unnamed protein product [Angiostrongylus costaricensis]